MMDNGKLLISIFYSNADIYKNCKKDLISLFGELEKESEQYNFDNFTKYYENEMGSGLVKRFLVFKKTITKQDLVEIKNKTTEIEKKYSVDKNRTINLDPGFVSKESVILASFKKKDFKEDLGDGIYAHEVLRINNEKVEEFWHTFPDFRSRIVHSFLFDSLD